MFHALEMKQALINAHIDLSATVIIMKTLLSLAQEHQITLLVETTDWPIHIMIQNLQELSQQFGEELKYSTDQFGTKFATMTLHRTMQK